MLIADGGGGYSGTTNWYDYDVKQMWATLENQQTDGHWQHVTGWQRTHELAGTHMSRLRTYREGLIQAWPPEKSAASRAYVERLDFLIESVEQSYEAAIANRSALSGATSAISDARRELKTVHDEYERKLAAKLEYERTVTPPTATPSPSPSPTPSPSPGPAPTPPVTQAELDRLNNRARIIMYGLSSELVQAQAQLKQPPPYQGRPGFEVDRNTDVYGGGAPPIIPPVVPAPTGGPSSAMPNGGSPIHHPVPAPSAPSVGPVLGGNGPTLGGVAPPIPTTPMAPVSPPVITPTPPSSPGIGPGFPAPLPPAPGGFGTTYPGPLGTSPVTGGLTKPGVGGVPSAPRAMPPGGMIGGTPGMGQPGAGISPARQINPVGGMIGGGAGSTAPMGGAGGRSGGTMSIGANGGQRSIAPPGSRPNRRGEDEAGQQWDPDNPWETDEGVAPVMRAPREVGRIDPGPAIGFDR
ncbi:hypothetical protein OG792_29655 [Micromonospora sp. NBC_01699]|uniref:hypothetical protein n=1 Tax=Micromonospora sp. NBC_01699 TaxID=2975984 RepID=UPI002E2B59A2|nr:hypothetical protein [Micromonospora sp. NBC_01699]